MTDFILIPGSQNDEVIGLDNKVFSFAVIFSPLLADVGVLMVALVV